MKAALPVNLTTRCERKAAVPERRIASARGWASYNSGERTSQVRQPNGAAQTGEYNKACEASS